MHCLTKLQFFPRLISLCKGIENAPLHVKQCYQSWVVKNPDHSVQILNMEEAEMLINRNDIIDNTTWSTMSIQAKSDVIRAFLLWKFGGIWVDATVLCLKPLSDWMNYTQPFVTFMRHDGGTNCKKCENGKLIGNLSVIAVHVSDFGSNRLLH